MSYWRGKRALVVGGSAGLGRAIANVLVQHEARVAIVARGQESLNQTVSELARFGADVIGIAADVTKTADLDRTNDTVQTAWSGLDLMCHCAGRSMRGTVLGTASEDFRRLWETNFLSGVECIQRFAAPLTASRGHVVLVGSLASKLAPSYLGAYPTSKFPLAALAQQLRLETEANGLHTLLVCPGPIARDEQARYAGQAPDVPPTAHQPGGGAKVRAIDPHWLAAKILRACECRRAELIVPARAKLLFAITQLAPSLGDRLLRRMTSG